MVYRMELTNDELIDVLDKKSKSATCIGNIPSPGMYKISDLNSILNSLFPEDVKVEITRDDIRLRSNLNYNKKKFTIKNYFLYKTWIYPFPFRKFR